MSLLSWGPESRSPPWVAAVCAILALFVLSTLSPLAHATGPRSTGATPRQDDGSSQLSGASREVIGSPIGKAPALQLGGPGCPSPAGKVPSCAPPRNGALPAPHAVDPAWINESIHLASSPPPSAYGSLAYDNALGEYIYFGGLVPGLLLSAETWTYGNGSWSYIGNSAGFPDAAYRASMAFIPTTNQVILFGGCGAYVCPTNTTWSFHGGLWTNITTSSCSTYCPTPVFGASLAWDDYDSKLLLFGGFTGTSTVSSSSYFDPVTQKWSAVTSSPYNPGARAYAQMAYDARVQGVVLYGGQNPSCPSLHAVCPTDSTWYFHGGSWSNQTATLYANSGVRPPARMTGAMGYDASTGYLTIMGGFANTTSAPDPSTWDLTCSAVCTWSLYSGPASASDSGVAMAEDSFSAAPITFGGYNYISGKFTESTYAFGTPFSVVIQPSVSPAVVNEAVSFNAVTTGGTLPINWYTWDLVELSKTFVTNAGSLTNVTFLQPRTVTINLKIVDGEGVIADGPGLSYTVNAFPQLNLSLRANIDTGLAGSFQALITAGTGGAPFQYVWNFGDGSALGTSAFVRHTYVLPGSYPVNCTVKDVANNTVARTVLVHVATYPTVAPVPSITLLDAKMSVTFTALVTNGTTPFGFNWDFGDGSNGTGLSVPHIYLVPGDYTAHLNFTDSGGASIAKSVSLHVNPALLVTAGPSPSSFAPDATQSVGFSVAISGGTAPFSYSWNFGDGATANGSAVNHAYSAEGTFTVLVIVTDHVGRTASASALVSVGPAPPSSAGVPLLAIGLGVVAAAIAIAVVALYLRRRSARRYAEEQAPSEAPSEDALYDQEQPPP